MHGMTFLYSWDERLKKQIFHVVLNKNVHRNLAGIVISKSCNQSSTVCVLFNAPRGVSFLARLF